MVSMSVRILSHSRSVRPRAAKKRRICAESQRSTSSSTGTSTLMALSLSTVRRATRVMNLRFGNRDGQTVMLVDVHHHRQVGTAVAHVDDVSWLMPSAARSSSRTVILPQPAVARMMDSTSPVASLKRNRVPKM